MFEDGRSKKVVLIAHCILNQNAISDGTAIYPAAFQDVVDILLKANIGIIQMPCPELCCLGLDRGNVHGAESPVTVENTRIRKEMQREEADRKLNMLAGYVTSQILEYYKHGFHVVGIIGADRSPNCGVNTTSDYDMEISGKGLFMEKLNSSLVGEGLFVPMIGIKSIEDGLEKIRGII